ncbi:hypothetical protein [Candidatus Poriferisodalis sp.]
MRTTVLKGCDTHQNAQGEDDRKAGDQVCDEAAHEKHPDEPDGFE